jgi:hypothetical protein
MKTAEDIVRLLDDPEMARRGAWLEASRADVVLPFDTCLRGFSRDVVPFCRVGAGRLALRHGEDGRRFLEETMAGGTPDQKATAALALARSGYETPLDILVSELECGWQDQKWQMRVARAVLQHYAPELGSHSGLRASSPSPGASWLQAQLRMRSGKATADDTLLHASAQARVDALRERVADEGAACIPRLREFLREGRPRKVAQEAFWQMLDLGAAAEPTVLEMFSSDSWTERKAATCLLRRWGKLTPEQYTTARNDQHIAVRFCVDRNPRYGTNRNAGN